MTAKEVKQLLGIGNQTLYNYRKSGKLKYTIVTNRTFVYDEEEVRNLIGKPSQLRNNYTYSRVSLSKQKNDLDSQERRLYDYCFARGAKVEKQFRDIKSGMCFSGRKDFETLFDKIVSGEVDTIFVENKDRLCRFGFELLEMVCEKFGSKIEVVSAADNKSYEQELTEDLLAIVHHFSMKSYSNRRKLNKIRELIIEKD